MKPLYYREITTPWGTSYIIFQNKKVVEFILPGKQKKITNKIIKVSKSEKWLKPIEKKIKQYFQGGKVDFNSLKNLDLSRYTAFEKKILYTLQKVRYGKVISYKELSRKSEKNKAARAVGNVMAKNKIPLLIPCHRVIRHDGTMGNFGYGQKYKERLLNLEKVTVRFM